MTKVPTHVAIIMDGNGRWAKKRLLPRVAGHNAGMLAMKEIVKAASSMGIKYLTVYAFSTENWKRAEEEIKGIFGLLVQYVASELEEICENNVRVRILGDISRVPQEAKESVFRAIEKTDGNTGMQFNIALNYGSRAEIVRAINLMGEDLMSGKISLPVDEETVSAYLYTGEENGNIPDPDLIIRTSGEERLSNFLLWQGAYSELAFTDTLWPDMTAEEFGEIVNSFGSRERRFGGRK